MQCKTHLSAEGKFGTLHPEWLTRMAQETCSMSSALEFECERFKSKPRNGTERKEQRLSNLLQKFQSVSHSLCHPVTSACMFLSPQVPVMQGLIHH